MASILHGNAKTTPRIRQEIQDADESLATLAARYSLNEKTVLKWKHADDVEDKKSGPATRRSAFTEVEQQAICTVRWHLRLPLDDLYLVFKPRIPKLSRSNLHRCLQHHGAHRGRQLLCDRSGVLSAQLPFPDSFHIQAGAVLQPLGLARHPRHGAGPGRVHL